jgi:nucleotide-binding universal stress UspA family protein
MYKKILVALDNTSADNILLPHITELAHFHHSEILLVHVAEGWAARYYNEFQLKESEEMVQDKSYLEQIASQLKQTGLQVDAFLAKGEPSIEILNLAKQEKCDLIAMTSHGHRLLADIFLGSTIEEVRHQTKIPMLILSAI